MFEVSRKLEEQLAVSSLNEGGGVVENQQCIQKMIDVYAVQRNKSNEYTFVLIFEDSEFSLKDFIVHNSSSSSSKKQVNREASFKENETNIEQAFVMVKGIAKQIKSLKRIGIFHSNIAPENILFSSTSTSTSASRKRVLLANFETALLRKANESEEDFTAVFARASQIPLKYRVRR